MRKAALNEAASRLAELINLAEIGEEIIITKDDGSSFKIIPYQSKKPIPKFGSAKGLIKMSDDFNDIPEGFEEYMP